MVAGSLVTRNYGTVLYHLYQRFAVFPSDRGQRVNACLGNRPRRTARTRTKTPDNESAHTKGRKQLEKNDERVNNLHRLRDHCVSDWFSVLLATVECLRRGAEGCWCWCSRDQTEKGPSESEEKPKVRYSMTHLSGE